jgi:hypothetical protein
MIAEKKNADQWTRAPRNGPARHGDTIAEKKMQINGPVHRGILFCKKMQQWARASRDTILQKMQ